MSKKPKKPVVLWDADVTIIAIEKKDSRHERILPYIKEAEADRLIIVLSEVTVSEVTTLNNLSAEGMHIQDQVRLIRDWLENPYIVRRSFSRGISERAAEIGRQFRIKRAGDKAVLATADFFGIPVIHTFDGTHLLPLDGKIGNPGIRIIEPDFYKDTLFENEEQEGQKESQDETRPEA